MSATDDALGSLIRTARQLIATERALGAAALPAERTPLPAIDPTARRQPAHAETTPQGTVEPTPPGTDDLARRLTPAEKAAALEQIAQEVRAACCCGLAGTRRNAVPGEGDPAARLMFIGEAPGADEDAQGRPFVGAAGQLLDKQIAAMGLRREQVFIANVLKCRPPGNRTPERDECETCSPFLMRQIGVIRPKAIVALGAVAAKTLLAMNAPMADLRGQWYDFVPAGAGMDPVKLRVTYHPAYLLRDPRQKKEAWLDLQAVMKYLGLPMPPKTTASP